MSNLKLVIPIDFNNVSKEALKCAINISSDESDEITLVHVLHNISETEAKQRLDDLIKSELANFKGSTNTAVISGEVQDDIGTFADTRNASFIVMGVHENTFFDKLLGSRAMDIIAYSKTPFITLQEGASFKTIDRIAMTIDLDTDSIQIVKAAAAMAQNFEADLLLVAVNHTDENFKRQIQSNMKVASNFLEGRNINSSIELIDGDDFIEGLLKLCKERGVDMISATYYLKSISLFSPKFVQHLMSNHLKLPVLTVDAQIFTKGAQYPFITT